jgi:L-lactate dehydrogenase complex protein LldF
VSAAHHQFIRDISKEHRDPEWASDIVSEKKIYREAFDDSIRQFSNLETAKRRAAFVRWKALDNLDKFLIQFEASFIKSGGKVIWAQDAGEACNEIISIIKKSGVNPVVKSKSATLREIHLEESLQQENISFTETDLDGYIAQHPDLSSGNSTTGENKSQTAATHIRKSFNRAVIGITGANFLLAEQGAVVISENEGNATLAASKPRIHIAVAGIDKIIPSLSDLHVLWPLLAIYSAGQKLTAYNSIITGPKRNGDADGPDEMYIVLIDNGRSSVLSHPAQRNILGCIRCGACLYSDPVYQVIGRAPYRSSWTGPLGALVQPLIKGMKSHGFYNRLSTLSAADSEVCPVNINFNKLILENRRQNIEQQLNSTSSKVFYFLWKKAMLKRELVNWKSLGTRNLIMNTLFLKSPEGLRDMKSPAKESFNEIWRKRISG